jgi:hypothetical protein
MLARLCSHGMIAKVTSGGRNKNGKRMASTYRKGSPLSDE